MKKIMHTCILLILYMLIACKSPTGYEKLVIEEKNFNETYQKVLQTESKRTQQVNDIFFGVHFKMTAAEFYAHCNNMFKQHIFDGGYDMQVSVKLDSLFNRPVKMMFFPSFDKPFISKIKSHFTYTNANIFNKADCSGVLMKELIPVLMNWYHGNEFMKMPSDNPLKGPGYVKVDANRKITVIESDNGTEVDVIYDDLKPSH